MRVTVVRPGELGPEEARVWAGFQQQSPVTLSPFMSLAFAQAVDRFHPGARVAVVEDGGNIQAFLPYQLGSRAIGLPIGSPMNDLQGFIQSEVPINARWVVQKAGLRGWRFGQAPAEQRTLIPYHYDGTLIQALAIDLSAGYKSYFNDRSKSLTTKIMRQRRSLERRIGTVRLEWQSSAPAESLRQLIAWKASKYHGTEMLFSDPMARSLIQEMGTAEDENCCGVVSVLSAGGRPVAINLGMTGPRGLAGWFAAYDHDLGRFSPGTLLILAVAEEAAARGISYYDLGYGQHSYKLRLANTSYPVAGGAVWVSRAEELVRRIYRQRILARRVPGSGAREASGSPPAFELAS